METQIDDAYALADSVTPFRQVVFVTEVQIVVNHCHTHHWGKLTFRCLASICKIVIANSLSQPQVHFEQLPAGCSRRQQVIAGLSQGSNHGFPIGTVEALVIGTWYPRGELLLLQVVNTNCSTRETERKNVFPLHERTIQMPLVWMLLDYAAGHLIQKFVEGRHWLSRSIQSKVQQGRRVCHQKALVSAPE